MRWSWWFLALALLPTAGCGKSSDSDGGQKVAPVEPTPDLAAARAAYTSKLTHRGPAPQRFAPIEPPPGVTEVEYVSGDLKLKAWLSDIPPDGKKRPAVVFLHGGFAFGGSDWDDASPYIQAGFVLFMPMLRGENGNPGHFESFLGEVDDAVAAGRYVAALPGVDPQKVYVVGHSAGAILTALVAAIDSPYKAAAAFDGWLDMESFARTSLSTLIPYDRKSVDEVRIRNPMAFAAGIRIPLRLYVGAAREENEPFANKARRAGRSCELFDIGGDHQTMVEPAVRHSLVWFRELAAK